MNTVRQTRNDYGVLNDVSRGLNHMLGDRTGRTITQRTQDGVANMTNGQVAPSGLAIHFVMGLGVGMATSKNKTLHYIGIALLILILAAWIAGSAARNY